MKLVHYTPAPNTISIKLKGLMAKEKGLDTQMVNICLDKFKPKEISNLLDLNNCIYLMPYNADHTPFGKVNRSLGVTCFEIDHKDLDINKIYTASSTYSSWISDSIKKALSQTNKEKALEDTINSAYFKGLCIKYWKSFKSFKLYRAIRVNNKNDDGFIEYLYFDDIPADVIRKIDVDTSMFYE